MTKRTVGVLKLKTIIDWNAFLATLIQVTGYDKKDWSKGGNLPFHPLLMFKILILQSFHGLSDDAMEYQIGDRLSFMNFLDLQMGNHIPDAKTIWDFKELIEKDKAILADSAYKSEKNEQVMLDRDLEDFITLKAYRNKALTEEDQRFNKRVNRMRVRVEHVFGRMKYMGADFFRKIGIQRARQHNSLCNLSYNMDRYAFLQS